MNDKIVKVMDSWMPFILCMLIFLAGFISLVMGAGTIHVALQGIILGMVLIFGLHYIPTKKKG